MISFNYTVIANNQMTFRSFNINKFDWKNKYVCVNLQKNWSRKKKGNK